MKRKRTPQEKAARKRKNQEFMIVFIGGKQKRVRRPTMIDGLDENTWIRQNADPIWLVQNEMYDYLHQND
ncbi:MAG: hypothetical protein H7834_15025 [Magnetococcus sp. YQC-9]